MAETAASVEARVLGFLYSLAAKVQDVQITINDPIERQSAQRRLKQYVQSLDEDNFRRAAGEVLSDLDKNMNTLGRSQATNFIASKAQKTKKIRRSNIDASSTGAGPKSRTKRDATSAVHEQPHNPAKRAKFVQKDSGGYSTTNASQAYLQFHSNPELYDLETPGVAEFLAEGYVLFHYPNDYSSLEGPSKEVMIKAKTTALRHGQKIEETIDYKQWFYERAFGAPTEIVSRPTLDEKKEAQKKRRAARMSTEKAREEQKLPSPSGLHQPIKLWISDSEWVEF